MVECPTLAEAKAKIAELGLKVQAAHQDKIDELEAVPTAAAIEPVG